MPQDSNKHHALLWQLICLAGCASPLAPHDYRGEVIFQAQGIVESAANTESWHELRPALAFRSGSQLLLDESISVRRVHDDGIGGDFFLELFEPPVDEVMSDFETHPDWGRVALASIVAVPEVHPERLEVRHMSSFSWACSEDQPCDCAVDEFQRKQEFEFQSASYSEVLCCPEVGSPDDACAVASSEGDVQIKERPGLPVAALVQDVYLIYIEQAAPMGSEMAFYLFRSHAFGLSAGYHLLRVTRNEHPEESDQQWNYEIVGTEDVALEFRRDVQPWGINL